ncbi:Hypothetical predicted protein, partial [Paramuricea clavata]
AVSNIIDCCSNQIPCGTPQENQEGKPLDIAGKFFSNASTWSFSTFQPVSCSRFNSELIQGDGRFVLGIMYNGYAEYQNHNARLPSAASDRVLVMLFQSSQPTCGYVKGNNVYDTVRKQVMLDLEAVSEDGRGGVVLLFKTISSSLVMCEFTCSFETCHMKLIKKQFRNNCPFLQGQFPFKLVIIKYMHIKHMV